MVRKLLGLIPGAGIAGSALKIGAGAVGLVASLLLFIKPLRKRVFRCIANILLWPFRALLNVLCYVWQVLKKFLCKLCTILKNAIDALLSAVLRLVAKISNLFGHEAPDVSSEKSAEEHDVDEALTDQEKYDIEKEDKLLKRDVSSTQKREVADGDAKYESSAQIVGVAEPIGKWTKLVMSERQERLARLFSSGARVGGDSGELPNGFWQMFVRLPSRFQGKYMARSR
ncbi:hypothetical protein ACIS_00476 [Anaplasma centrale str. Israel]|uniref:Uncharacterized protein n=1 Tax=Anaplasma centrale (strain Israel) TaxID=574556 RepID=D1AU70_ANACI|nr:hypothetical protein [Anaplasma centrale]ACZ49098.1 hypothetical protein ACIS_00476 [Anaplasma centrale str. Israel]